MIFRNRKKMIFAVARTLIVASCALSAAGCAEKQTEALPAVSGEIGLPAGVELDTENTVFDDFVGGVDSDLWYIGKQAWGSGNGGVIPENVGYTDEGVLVFTGRGAHYAAGEVSGAGSVKDGSMTGGAIISKFLTGPGRYETKLKVLPRLGACTAMWVYAYRMTDAGAENHEIDIELPGGKTRGAHSFNAVLNTNYITETYNQSQDVDLAANRGTEGIYSLADGEWHTFGFDWYTNPERVVYYVDGVITAISDVFVPSLQTRLWLGVWFPNNSGFVGTAEFEKDYLEVDWIRYTPFKDQPCEEFTPPLSSSQTAALSEYPAAPSVYEKANKVSNGDFEYALTAKSSGWSCAQLPRADAPALEEECRIAAGAGKDGSVGAFVKDLGVLGQNIDSVYEGFSYLLTLDAKCGEGQRGYLQVLYRSEVNTLKTQTIEISGESWSEISASLVAPAGCTKIRLEFYTEEGNSMQLDNIAVRRA